MKKIKKLKLESVSNSTFEMLRNDQMAKFLGGATYGTLETASAEYYHGKTTTKGDGPDQVD